MTSVWLTLVPWALRLLASLWLPVYQASETEVSSVRAHSHSSVYLPGFEFLGHEAGVMLISESLARSSDLAGIRHSKHGLR